MQQPLGQDNSSDTKVCMHTNYKATEIWYM